MRAIPTDVFLSVLERRMEAEWPYLSRYERIMALADRCSVKSDSLDNALKKDALEFDLADLLLCKLGQPHLWWVEPLAEFYWTLDLDDTELRFSNTEGKRRCACPGCTKSFKVVRARGKVRQRYCSDGCAQKAGRMRRGVQRRVNDGRRFVCRHGHERTPDSVEVLKNGSRRCKVCRLERTHEFREAKRLEFGSWNAYLRSRKVAA